MAELGHPGNSHTKYILRFKQSHIMDKQLIAGLILLAAGAIFIIWRSRIGEIYEKIYKVKRFDNIVGLAGVINIGWGIFLVFIEF